MPADLTRRGFLQSSIATAAAAVSVPLIDQLARAAPPVGPADKQDQAERYITVWYQFDRPSITALTGPNGLPNGKNFEHIFSHSSPGMRSHPDSAKLVHSCGPSFKFCEALDLHKYKEWGKADDAKLKDWAKEFREECLDRTGPADYWAFNEMPIHGYEHPEWQAQFAKWIRMITDASDGGPRLPCVFYFTEQNVEDEHWKQLTDEFWAALDETCVLVVGEHYHSWDFVFKQSADELADHLFGVAKHLNACGKKEQQRIAREKYAVLHSSYYGPKDTGWHGPLNTEHPPADLKKYCQRVIEATRASEFGKRRIGFGPLVTKDFDNRILAPLREALVEDARAVMSKPT